jgi:predicted DNA-binding transcriptional regulator YafY
MTVTDQRFNRREKSYQEFSQETEQWGTSAWVDLTLRFDPFIRPVVEEYYPSENTEEEPDGSLIVNISMPEDGWVYGLILSYGKFVEVLEPERIRSLIKNAARDIFTLYE